MGHLIRRGTSLGEGVHTVVIGFPSDKGSERSGGRMGAEQAPEAIRERLYRMTPDARIYDESSEWLAGVHDLGDLHLEGSLERSQEQLGDLVGRFLADGLFVVLLGGGHETTYGHFLGYVKAEVPFSLVNWDSQAGVRPMREGLGSCRQALEHPSKLVQRYVVGGLQPYSVGRDHYAYLRKRRCSAWWREEIDPQRIESIYAGVRGSLMTSFDIDAVDQAFAPGVSSPCTNGLTPDLWLYAADRAGAHRCLRSIEIVELNPSLDRDRQTAQLAALTIWTTLMSRCRHLVARAPLGKER